MGSTGSTRSIYPFPAAFFRPVSVPVRRRRLQFRRTLQQATTNRSLQRSRPRKRSRPWTRPRKRTRSIISSRFDRQGRVVSRPLSWWRAWSVRHCPFHPTLGFEGEGPSPSPPNFTLDRQFMATSREILHGVSTVRDRPSSINSHTTDDDIHRLLLQWALDGNQSLPVAARYQQNPAGVATLTGNNPRATLAARSGLNYQLTRRPSQNFLPDRRPCRTTSGPSQ